MPDADGTEMGPIITQGQYQRVNAVLDAVQSDKRLEVVTGGKAMASGGSASSLNQPSSLMQNKVIRLSKKKFSALSSPRRVSQM